MGLQALFRERWKSAHFRRSFWVAVVAIAAGAGVASAIQTRFDLYSSSMTMTLLGSATAIAGMLILWLLDRRWYGWAWAATLILPVAFYFGAMALLTANPPTPPSG